MKTLLFANTDWYLYNFRRSLAEALRAAGHDVLLVSPDGPYGPRLREMGFRWIPAPMVRRSLNPLREFRLLRWLRKLMAQEQVDMVHAFTIKPAIYGSIAARWAGSAARINSVAGLGYVFISNSVLARLLRPLLRQLFRYALAGDSARVILQNPNDVALFTNAGLVRPSKIRLIPSSGVDSRRFSPRTGDRPPGPFRVLLAARLLWDKGLAEYVEASRLVRARAVEMHFLLAGTPDPGNPAAVPEQVVRDWVAQGLIQWLGHVDDMPALLRSVDAVVLPSYREGLPKGLIEAAACGLPLVTTDVPGCREVVTHDREGLLVPAKRAPELADAIVRLRQDPELCARLGTVARRKALALFEERVVIERTLQVYAEASSGSCPQPIG